MNQGKYIFAQVMEFLPARVFDRCVTTYDGNKWTRHFTCWNQMLCMMFGQLSGRESLRDLIIGLSAHRPKYYHLGLGKNISRSNLANANEKRDYRIFESFAYELIGQVRQCSLRSDDFQLDVEGSVYAFDATVIDLCLNVFWWAKFRKAKGGIKLHTLYDIKTSIASFVVLTPASVHDVNALDYLLYEAGAFYILDRGYIDFERLFEIHRSQAYFVIRAKDNLQFERIYSDKADKSKGVMCDQTVRLKGFYVSKNYPDKLRRIKFYDKLSDRTFVFLTNHTELDADQIAQLYHDRWKVELFFKWIKQHLKVKTFWGTTPNAVKTQVYIALITYTLVALIKHKLKSEKSIYTILQILSISLLDKTPLNQLLTNQHYKNVKELNYNQLEINLI